MLFLAQTGRALSKQPFVVTSGDGESRCKYRRRTHLPRIVIVTTLFRRENATKTGCRRRRRRPRSEPPRAADGPRSTYTERVLYSEISELCSTQRIVAMVFTYIVAPGTARCISSKNIVTPASPRPRAFIDHGRGNKTTTVITRRKGYIFTIDTSRSRERVTKSVFFFFVRLSYRKNTTSVGARKRELTASRGVRITANNTVSRPITHNEQTSTICSSARRVGKSNIFVFVFLVVGRYIFRAKRIRR